MSSIVACKVGEETILLDIDRDYVEDGKRNWELWRAQSYATKEPDTIGWIDSFLQEGDVIYDIGANIGQYALYAAKRLKGRCEILAFEPESLNYAKLNRNIVLNKLTETITAYCLAVADSMRLDLFYVQSFMPGASLHTWAQPITQGGKAFSPQHKQGVMGVSLDDLVTRFSLSFPNHIKIDVDGIEDLVIKGGENTLADSRLRSVLVEIYLYRDIASQIEEMFFQNNFILHNADLIDYEPGTVQNFIFKR